MDYGTRAKENFLNGYNCCQAVFLACTDELGLDTETRAKIASSFGGGMGGDKRRHRSVHQARRLCAP